MKILRILPSVMVGIVLAATLIGCSPMTGPGGQPVAPAQQAITATTTSYQALDTAILAADAAVTNGTLKGDDARTTLKGLTAAKAGLDLALQTLRNANAAAALRPATPASGAPTK